MSKASQNTAAAVAASQPSDDSDTLYRLAQAEAEGYTLIPAEKVKGNHTVKAVEPTIERDGFVVVKRIA